MHQPADADACATFEIEHLVHIHIQTPTALPIGLRGILADQVFILCQWQRALIDHCAWLRFDTVYRPIGGTIVDKHKMLHTHRPVMTEKGVEVVAAIAHQRDQHHVTGGNI